MICLILPLLIGFGIDCVLGDPHSLPHPVVLIGTTISALEQSLACSSDHSNQLKELMRIIEDPNVGAVRGAEA